MPSQTTFADPLPEEITAARARAGLTQAEAAAVVHSIPRSWQRWESGERSMHPAFFELFKIKTGQK